MNSAVITSLDDFCDRCTLLGTCLTIASLNVRSLSYNFDDIVELLSERKFDVLALSETWLVNNAETRFYNIAGYDFFHFTRFAIARGAGVGIYVKSQLHASVSLQPVLHNLHFESICCTLRLNGKALPFSIFSIYRNFRCSIPHFINDLSELFQAGSIQSSQLLAIGDFNIDMFKDTADTKNYKSLLQSYGLRQLLEQPTRITPTSATLIDHIVATSSLNILLSASCPCKISDHNLIICAVRLDADVPSDQTIVRTTRDYSAYDKDRFLNELFWTPFHRVKLLPNVNDMTDLFMQMFESAADRHAPVCTKSVVRSGPKKLNVPYDALIATWKMSKKFHHRLFKAHGRSEDYSMFCIYRSLVKKRLNKLRSEICFSRLNQQHRPCDIWKEAKKICNLEVKRTVPTVDPQAAGVHYSTVGAKTAKAAKANNVSNISFNEFLDDSDACVTAFKFLRVTDQDIFAALRSLRPNSPGSDYADKQLIVDALPAILPILKYIFNQSFSLGVFPRVWKHALVTPVYKGAGIQSEPVSYRPISLLSLFGKLLELIAQPQLDSFMTRNDRLPALQSGFRRRYSTETAILKISSDIFERLGRGEIVLVLSLDFSKAFDTVCHDILLKKLSYHGVHGTELKWFSSYLQHRTQQVQVNGKRSSIFDINSGVPQGSILSPLLYIVYTADMPLCLECACYYSYADDTQLLHSGKADQINDVITELEADFQHVAQWAASNLLKLNADKTQFLVLKGNNLLSTSVQLRLQGQPVIPSEKMKILGVFFDSSMSFTAHADYIASKVSGFLRMFAHRRNKLPRKTLILLVNAYVSSQLSYCLSALCVSPSLCEKFQQLQNYAVRVIFGLHKFSHVSHLRNNLCWPSIKQLAVMKFGVIVHRAIYGTTPNYLRLNLSQFLPSHSYHIRTSNLRQPFARNRFCGLTFEARSIEMYNKTMHKEIWAESLSVFKRKQRAEIMKLN
jgi:exonuclease III